MTRLNERLNVIIPIKCLWEWGREGDWSFRNSMSQRPCSTVGLAVLYVLANWTLSRRRSLRRFTCTGMTRRGLSVSTLTFLEWSFPVQDHSWTFIFGWVVYYDGTHNQLCLFLRKSSDGCIQILVVIVPEKPPKKPREGDIVLHKCHKCYQGRSKECSW